MKKVNPSVKPKTKSQKGPSVKKARRFRRVKNFRNNFIIGFSGVFSLRSLHDTPEQLEETIMNSQTSCCGSQSQAASCECECSSASTLLFPCSGGSDVGALSDQAARKLTAEGIANMYCLAGIGGRVSGILASTQAADRIVAIDGCPLNCAKATLEQAGFSHFEHFNLTEIGLPKGQSPVTDERIQIVMNAAKDRL